MSYRQYCSALAALSLVASIGAAQQSTSPAAAQHVTPPSTSPFADAFRDDARNNEKRLVAAAEAMPADKYTFKPTPAQMSFGDIVAHLAQANDYFCGAIGGSKAPTRSKVAGTDNKDVLVARLKESFTFCNQSLASMDDSKLAEQLPSFGGRTWSRAAAMLSSTSDWADHYSQTAIYLRLNGLLPPTAKKPAQ